MAEARDPSSHRTKSQIKKMDRGLNSMPKNIKGRTQQNQARALMTKKRGAAAVAGRDVNHIKPIRSGGSNSPSNLNIQSKKVNRGWEKK